MASVGGFACAAVVCGYAHALGINRDVEHARGLVMAVLLLCSAAFAATLTGLRKPAARWIVLGTVVALAALVQAPALSACCICGRRTWATGG